MISNFFCAAQSRQRQNGDRLTLREFNSDDLLRTYLIRKPRRVDGQVGRATDTFTLGVH